MAPALDSVGRVIDFSVLKDRIGGWIDKWWDHTMILGINDIKTISGVRKFQKNKPLFILSENPTAENMASFLLNNVCPSQLLGTGVIVTKIVLWETENCFASVELDFEESKRLCN